MSLFEFLLVLSVWIRCLLDLQLVQPLQIFQDSGFVGDFGSVVMVSQDISNAVLDDTRNILLGHVAVGRLTSSQLTNDLLLETASPLKSTVRINIYQQPKKVKITNILKGLFDSSNIFKIRNQVECVINHVFSNFALKSR